MSSLSDPVPAEPPSPVAPPGRDLRAALFTTVFLLLAFCAGMAAYALVKESRRPWAGVLYARSARMSVFERFQVGLAVRPGPGQVLHVAPGGPAHRAGLVAGDVVLEVGGRSVRDSAGLHSLASRARPGQVLPYRIARQGTERTLPVRLEPALHARRGGFLRYSLYLLVGLTFLALGTFVYARRPRDSRAALFFLLSACAAVPFVLLPCLQAKSAQGIEPMFRVDPQAMIGGLLAGLAGAAFGAFLLHFALIFPRPRPIVRARPYTIHWVYVSVLGLVALELSAIGCLMLLRKYPVALAVAAGLLGLGLTLVAVFRRPPGTSVRKGLLERPYATLIGLVGVSLALAAAVVILRGMELRAAAVGLALALILLPTVGLMLVGVAMGVLTIASLVRSYRESTLEERHQLRWPLWGMSSNLVIGGLVSAVAIAASFAYGPATADKLQWLADGVYLPSTLFIPLGFAIGILKYRLLDLDFVIRKTAVYATVTALMAALFFVVVAGIGGWMAQTLGIQNQWITVMGTVTVAGLFVPVRDRVQRVIDRRFYRTRYVGAESLARLGRLTAETTDARTLADTVCEELLRTLRPRAVAVLARTGTRGALQALAAPGLGEEREPALSVALDRDQAAALLGPPRRVRDLPEALGAAARLARADWVVPVRRQRDLLGLILVGPPLSDAEYDPADLDYLSAVAAQLAAGLAALELAYDPRELEEARQIQTGLLPATLPALPGVRFAAHWQPARQVAGDYYDAFLVDESAAVLCIADVTGKGMPAALLMSNLQAAVRAFASAERSPRKLCERLNRVVCANVGEGRFVTMFLGVLDARRRTLTYVNAGHNPPLLLGSERFLELQVGGPLLGVVPDAAYQEDEVALERGDRIVLYTDGMTEAMGEGRELFGEERLAAVLREHREADPKALQERAVEAVTAFCRGEFQDDATVLVAAIDS